VTAYRGLPEPSGLGAGRRTPGPGLQGRPGHPTTLSRVRTAEGPLAMTGILMNGTTRLPSEQVQSRGDVVRERYQALEELHRSQSLQRSLSRPKMLSAVRSFSYDLPTQLAEMERMSSQRTSPPPIPPPPQTPLSTVQASPSGSITPRARVATGAGYSSLRAQHMITTHYDHCDTA
jgi:hypothetical protein